MRTFINAAIAFAFAGLLSGIVPGTAAAQVDSRVIRADQNGQTVAITAGTQVDILLEENTGSCSTWALKQLTGTALTLKSEDHLDGDETRADGTIVSVYEGVFQAEIPGMSTLEITCTTADGLPSDRLFVTVIVR